MTYIEKVYIRGFKSFAKPIGLELGKGFNCFIGPNGSGKTNIGDGLIFVLGKTSSKQMRAENAANLIFNGGKKGSAMREAEVAVHFSNREKEFPIATETVKISRIVKQSGNSHYFINDEKRTRQQVVDLLNKARIHPDGFNIVLQGDITLFADMRSEDRRILIEDISGISIYEEKKHKALLELEKVEQKLNEASLILKEREVHLRELKKERDQALNFKELETSIKESKATYLHLQIKEKEFKKDEIESKLNNCQSHISNILKKIKEHKDGIEKSKLELEDINKNIEEKGEVEQINLQKNLKVLRESVIKDSTRLETVTNEINHVKQRINSLKTDEKEILEKIKQLESELKDLNKKSKQLEIEENRIQNELKNKQKITGSFVIEKLESEIKKFYSKLFEIKQDISTMNIDINKHSQELKIIEERIEKISSPELKKKYQELDVLESSLSRLVDKSNVTQGMVEANMNKILKLQEELSELQGTKIRISQSLAGNQALNAILNANINGVYGTIASLGRVEEKYATALEVAAGARINSIITDNDVTAANCINTLKEKKVGIAMFLPLNKLQTKLQLKELEQLKNLSGVRDLAINLIQYDKKFEKAFYYVFGATLVVDDLSIARKVGIARVRMVTLDGDLVETSGAMIGGYRRATKGVFEQKGIDLKITQKESEITNLKNDIRDLLKQKKDEQEEIQKISNEKAILGAEVINIQHSLKLEDIKQLKNKKLELESHVKELQHNIKSLEKDDTKTIKEIEFLQDKRKSYDQRKEYVHIESLHEQHKEVREVISQTYTQIKNIQNQIASIYKPEIEKIQEIISQHLKEIGEFTLEASNLNNTLKENQTMLMDTEKKEKKFREDYKSLFNKRNKISEQIRTFDSFISQEDFKQREIEKRLNEISLQRAKMVAELEALQSEYEPYIGTKLRRNISREDLKKEMSDFERLLKEIGNVNMRALEIYDIILKEFEDLMNKNKHLKKEKEDVLVLMTEIEGKKKRIFLKTYKQIADNFARIFSMLSSKGDAYLELENKDNPLDGGINVNVRWGGTRFLDLQSLSGGEKTLTALAFIFAIQEFEPAPFYLLDEIDAALDKTNSQLLAQLITQYAKLSQVVLISHNDYIITEADYLYGVSMQQNGISKITSLKL